MRKKLLIVDDEEDLRKLIRWFFKSKNYEIIEASDGNEALDKVREENPDIVLLDIMMPEIDGWEVAKKIKDDQALAHIPIAMLSVLSSDEDIDKSLHYSGADSHLGKPIDFYSLNKTVMSLTGEI